MIREYLSHILYIIRKKSDILQEGGAEAKMIFDVMYYSTSAITTMLNNLNNQKSLKTYAQKSQLGGQKTLAELLELIKGIEHPGLDELEKLVKDITGKYVFIEETKIEEFVKSAEIANKVLVAFYDIKTNINFIEAEENQQKIGDLITKLSALTTGIP